MSIPHHCDSGERRDQQGQTPLKQLAVCEAAQLSFGQQERLGEPLLLFLPFLEGRCGRTSSSSESDNSSRSNLKDRGRVIKKIQLKYIALAYIVF